MKAYIKHTQELKQTLEQQTVKTTSLSASGTISCSAVECVLRTSLRTI